MNDTNNDGNWWVDWLDKGKKLKLVLAMGCCLSSLCYAVVYVHSESRNMLQLEYEQCDVSLQHCQDIGDVQIMNGPYGTLPKKDAQTKPGYPEKGKVIRFYEYIGADTAWWKPITGDCSAQDGQNLYFNFDWNNRTVVCSINKLGKPK